MVDFSFSDDVELQKLGALVEENPEDFEHWDNLVRAAESQEGGLNRNSSPNAVSATRETYDRFLARFPLFYAFWKRYADLEFAIAGTEAAELVYERGVASTGFSVDLWTNYCAFKIETSHDADVIRELFERGAESIGLDFLAHPFWDRYLEFEERSDEPARAFVLLSRIVEIPLHAYSRYYERYQGLLTTRRDQDLAMLPAFTQAQLAVQQQLDPKISNPSTFSQALRKQLYESFMHNYRHIQQEVTNRWPFEENIKRPYFHVTDLEDSEIENWRSYLDFEEKAGDYTRTKVLYERCLVTTAIYEEFWFRYARWMMGQGNKVEEVRNIYQRASCVFVKITQPAIRHAWARYEEAQGRADVAADIYQAILLELPDDINTYRSLVNVRRRNDGLPAAIELLQHWVQSEMVSQETSGALLAERARLTWQLQGDYDAAASLFTTYKDYLSNAHTFWSGWLQFEIDRPSKDGNEDEVHQRVEKVHIAINTTAALTSEALNALALQYLQYLDLRGGKEAMQEAVLLDAYTNGPQTIQAAKVFRSLFGNAAPNGASKETTLAT